MDTSVESAEQMDNSGNPVEQTDNSGKTDDRKKVKPDERKKVTVIIMILAAIIILLSIWQCAFRDRGPRHIRDQEDISEFTIIYINGVATLFWADPTDSYFEYVEITWDPDGQVPIRVPKGVQRYAVPGLDLDTIYNFRVRAVDMHGNQSDNTTGGTGKTHRHVKSEDSPPAEIMGISGTPIVGQATLSWTNLDPSEYEYIEITYDPQHEALIRVPKGVNNRTITRLTNGIEHTFYAAAVDARGNRKPLIDVGLFIPDHPTSPEYVIARPIDGQVTLIWQDPTNPNLSHMEIVYSPDGYIPVAVAKGVETHTFTGLNNNIDYEFTVYAVDNEEFYRAMIGVIAVPLEPSFAMDDIEDFERFKVRGRPVTGIIRLDWNDPAMLGLERVEILYNSGGADSLAVVHRGVETLTFTGLDDNLIYEFLALGVNAAGTRQGIPNVRLSTPERVPGTRVNPVSRQVTITWQDPDDPLLSHIELTYSPDGQTPIPVDKGVETYTFTGLQDAIEYEFNVRAVLLDGSHYGVPIISATVPELPTISGMPIDGRLSIRWDDLAMPHAHTGIIHTPDGQRPVVIARGVEQQTFTGLTDGQLYTFTVYAADAAGNRFGNPSANFFIPATVAPAAPPRAPGVVGNLTWIPVRETTFGDSTVLAISYGVMPNGQGRWVAGGTDGRIAYSVDNGTTWLAIQDTLFGALTINVISYANGRWIAGTRNGRIAYSTNASNWTSVRETHFTQEQSVNAIVFGNGIWLAGGSDGIIVWSDDAGVTWNRNVIRSFGNAAVHTLALSGNRWIAGGARGQMAYSDDNGYTWTAVNSTFGETDINVVINDRGRLYAGGWGQRVAWSADGVTWRQLPRPFFILGMGFNGNRWVAGGQEGRMAWSSDAGDTWNMDNSGRNIFDESWVHAVAFGRPSGTPGRWLSGGQNGKIIYADEEF